MRYVYLATFFVVVLTVGILGFRGSISSKPPLEVFPDRDRQPKLRPQESSNFFADGRVERPLPAGVVARGNLRADAALYQGRTAGGEWVRGIPSPLTVDARFLQRGRERFEISCAPCHGKLGDGNGITKSYGMGATPTFHDDRIRTMAEGEIFNTITNGKATMMGYADKVVPEDRWAIIAYVRTLQGAQHGSVGDVPAARKAELGIQ